MLKFPVLIIVLVIIAIYFNAVGFDFSPLDDQPLIVQQIELLKDPANIGKIFSSPVYPETISMNYYRPIFMFSFMIDAIIGYKNPVVYHITNIVLHIISCSLLYLLLIRIVGTKGKSLLFSLLFAAHPVHLHTVAWIPGRNDSMLAILGIVSFLSLLNFLDTNKVYWLIIHFIAFFLALLTKESAIVLPMLFVIAYYYFQK
ncbi:MAG: glycosyltransferase family 39 protein, partial [Bacteroidetes bacterium]|nr:glycosyltransferase family 39 protein [Bacteroidota bacterium]